jgi:hypothetical protein
MPSATRLGAEQIGQTRNRCPFGLSNKSAGPARAQYGVRYGRHLQDRGDGFGDAPKFAAALQLGKEISQITVFHRSSSGEIPIPGGDSRTTI